MSLCGAEKLAERSADGARHDAFFYVDPYFSIADMNELTGIISQLEVIDSHSTSGGISKIFIEITTGPGETVVSANQEGPVHLARQLLSLATRSAGAHFHLDESSVADFAETNVVLVHKPAKPN